MLVLKFPVSIDDYIFPGMPLRQQIYPSQIPFPVTTIEESFLPAVHAAIAFKSV